MIIPTDTWLTIVSYRDFHDIPRLILASSEKSEFWILDSIFDDSQDEYSINYEARFVGDDLERARSKFEAQANGIVDEVAQILPISSFEFDPTKREMIRLSSAE